MVERVGVCSKWDNTTSFPVSFFINVIIFSLYFNYCFCTHLWIFSQHTTIFFSFLISFPCPQNHIFHRNQLNHKLITLLEVFKADLVCVFVSSLEMGFRNSKNPFSEKQQIIAFGKCSFFWRLNVVLMVFQMKKSKGTLSLDLG